MEMVPHLMLSKLPANDEGIRFARLRDVLYVESLRRE